MLAQVRQKYLLLFPFLTYLRLSICQEVIDQFIQEADYINEFCPKSRYCEEGTHVMCMYYDERNPIGPRCANYQKVDVNLVQQRILQIINAIRSRVALGEERAKKKLPLPRAYGMFQLEWDSELARYAQVLADQCVLKHDLCRATSKFGKPGQSLGLIRFNFPNWMPRGLVNDPRIKPGYGEDKLWYGLQGILKSWYDQKVHVTPEMIERYPDFVFSNTTAGRLYLEMVVPSATHMGCGMSGFTDILFKSSYGEEFKISHNTIVLVCNFSERPEVNKRVYLTMHPGGKHDTERCGCPLGSREENDCLCVKGPRPVTKKPIIKFCQNPDEDCEQTVVVLPIFTLEDAPEQALVNNDTIQKMKLRFNKNVHGPKNSMEIIDFLEGAKRNRPEIAGLLNNALILPPVHQTLSSHFNGTYFGSDSVMTSNLHHQAKGETKIPTFVKKNANFHLQHIKSQETTEIRENVESRQAFSNADQMVNRYLHQQHQDSKILKINEDPRTPSDHVTEDHIIDTTTETTLNNAEDKIMNFKSNLNNVPNNSITYRNSKAKIKENSQNKILTLLDNLEREVKHVELDNEKKVMIDEKIRKIYGAIVKDHKNLHLNLEDLNQQEKKYSDTRFNFRHEDSSEYKNRETDVDRHRKRLSGRGVYKNNENDLNTDKIAVSHEMHDMNLRNHHGKEQAQYYRYNSNENLRDHDYENVEYLKHDKINEQHRNFESHYPLDNEEEMSPVSMERKIYREKFNNLQRKIHDSQNYRRRNMHGTPALPYLRRMRPTREEKIHSTTSRSPIDEYYMPDRARYLHGFR